MFSKVKNDSYIIAEIGQNHQGDLDTARRYIKTFADLGANAVKFQTRDNKYLFSEEAYAKPYNSPTSFAATYGEHREKLELSKDSLTILKKDCQEFVEHRHDQSAFSILCKLNNVFCLSASECEWAEDEKGRFWDHLKDYPILAKKNKKLNFLKRFFF